MWMVTRVLLLSVLGAALHVSTPASHWLAPTLPCVRSPPLVMKGRPVGGGPSIRTKPAKKRLAAALSSPKPGEQQSAKKKRVIGIVSRGRQWQRFSTQRRAGAAAWAVLVRAGSTGEWFEIGEVSVSGDSLSDGVAMEGARAVQAVRLQKRIILEHAVRLEPSLSPQRDVLECGLRLGVGEEDEVEPVPVSAGTSGAADATAALEARACGFQGKPVARTGHYFAASETVQNSGKKVKLERMGIDSKSAVAEQFSKQLGLRSG